MNTQTTDTGYDPYDSTSTRNRRLDTVSIPTLVEIPDEPLTAEQVQREVARVGVRLAVRQAS